MKINKIPVYIITGFLGSGKTTFLNQFIHYQSDKRIIVVENEIGKTNIDGALIIESVEDVLELTAGCLCCNLNEKLYDLLFDLAKRRSEFDVLIIETTGIADPAAVAETIWTGGFMDKNYDLKNTICLADAQNMLQSIEQTDEARRQIAFSDIVLLNKCDLVDADRINDVKTIISDINPFAKVLQGHEGHFSHDDILQYSDHVKNRSEMQHKDISNNFTYKHKGIHTFTLVFDRPFDFPVLRRTLMLLLHVNKQQIYRIKGIIDIPDMENRIIIQSVYQSYRIEEGSLWGDQEVRESKIVFIGNEVEKESIERVFKQCLLKSVNLT
jgi:G3E family GTPase